MSTAHERPGCGISRSRLPDGQADWDVDRDHRDIGELIEKRRDGRLQVGQGKPAIDEQHTEPFARCGISGVDRNWKTFADLEKPVRDQSDPGR